MPTTPWQHGAEYRVTLKPDLRDPHGRRAVLPGTGTTYTSNVVVDDQLPADPEPLQGFPVEHPLTFDTQRAASATLDCGTASTGPDPCFPGGLNILFQGLWHDPSTGLANARARWYDARTSAWLSPDPMGAFDSENQYAFVAGAPNMYTDPTGELLLPVAAPIGLVLKAAFAAAAAYMTHQAFVTGAEEAESRGLPWYQGGLYESLPVAPRVYDVAAGHTWYGDPLTPRQRAWRAGGAAFEGALTYLGARGALDSPGFRRFASAFGTEARAALRSEAGFAKMDLLVPWASGGAPKRGPRVNLLRRGVPEAASYARRAIGNRVYELRPSLAGSGPNRWHRVNRWFQQPMGGPEGHHPLPRFLGGKGSQLLANLDPAVHADFHRLLRGELRHHGLPLGVGGRGGSAADWANYFVTNPGSQRSAFDAVLSASRQLDYLHGTSVTNSVWNNLLSGGFFPYP